MLQVKFAIVFKWSDCVNIRVKFVVVFKWYDCVNTFFFDMCKQVLASKTKIYMVLEYVNGGELFDRIVSRFF